MRGYTANANPRGQFKMIRTREEDNKMTMDLKFRKIIVALLAAATLVSCAANSGGETTGEVTTAAGTAAETTADETQTRLDYTSSLPDVTFDGMDYGMLTRTGGGLYEKSIWAEGITGDLINDAVYERNAAVSAKYDVNMTITRLDGKGNVQLNALEKSVMSGACEYDVCFAHLMETASFALDGIFLNLYDVEYIDLSKPYWCQAAIEGYSYGDKLLMAMSDMDVTANDYAHAILFNKQVADSYGVDGLYDLVYNNKWTFAKMRELMTAASGDINGNGIKDADDSFGFVFNGYSGELNFLWAGGAHITAKDSDNHPYLDMNNEHTVDVFNATYDLYWSDDSYNGDYSIFAADRALFMSTYLSVLNDLRDMNSDYGILPFPKYSENQESYGHMVDGGASILTIPRVIKDEKLSGAVTEALSCYSYNDLVPVYYDVLTTVKLTRDEDSAVMLDLIYNSRVFDFAYAYDRYNLSFMFQSLIEKKNTDFASEYASREQSENDTLNEVYALYEQLEG